MAEGNVPPSGGFRAAKREARQWTEAARRAYVEGGGARRTAQGVGDWVKETAKRYRDVHGAGPSFSEYIKADTTRATARTALGHTAQTMIQRRLKKAQRRGGLVSNVLYNFANIAMAGMMRRLKDDQTTFENVARVRRGDPDVYQMSHNELRSVRAHAQKYGGKDADQILAKATGELSRRWDQKASEHAGYDQTRHEKMQAVKDRREQESARNKEVGKAARREERDRRRADVAKQQMDHRQALHEQKLKHRMELRTVSGHGAAAKAGVQAQLKQAAGGAAKPAGKDKGPLQVIGKTKKGNLKVKTKTGNTRVATAEEVAASKKPRGGGVTPMRRSRRRSV